MCEICGSTLETAFRASTTPADPGDEPHRPVCAVCQTREYAFDRARSYANYQAQLVRAIVMLKFEHIEPLGSWFADRLTSVVRQEPESVGADIVVPVPLHRQRERERGYNQADLIARPLARRLRLPYRAVLLVRTRPRPNKHLLSARSAGNRYVALLPPARAARLTTYASYW